MKTLHIDYNWQNEKIRLIVETRHTQSLQLTNIMEKIAKKISMLLFVAAIFSFTACEKDNADDNSNDNTTTTTDESLKNTKWNYSCSAEELNTAEILMVTVEFGSSKYVSVDLFHQDYDSELYSGPYTYSNGSGTMDVRTDPQNQVSATFSISGNKMTLNFKSATYTLTKKES